MAKSKLSFTRSIVDKLNIEGFVSRDNSTITYEDENGLETEIKVVDLLAAFKNQYVKISVQLKNDEDLAIDGFVVNDEFSDDESDE